MSTKKNPTINVDRFILQVKMKGKYIEWKHRSITTEVQEIIKTQLVLSEHKEGSWGTFLGLFYPCDGNANTLLTYFIQIKHPKTRVQRLTGVSKHFNGLEDFGSFLSFKLHAVSETEQIDWFLNIINLNIANSDSCKAFLPGYSIDDSFITTLEKYKSSDKLFFIFLAFIYDAKYRALKKL